MDTIVGLYKESDSFTWVTRGPFDTEFEAVRNLLELVGDRKVTTGYAYPPVPKITAIKVVKRRFDKKLEQWMDRDVLYYQEFSNG